MYVLYIYGFRKVFILMFFGGFVNSTFQTLGLERTYLTRLRLSFSSRGKRIHLFLITESRLANKILVTLKKESVFPQRDFFKVNETRKKRREEISFFPYTHNFRFYTVSKVNFYEKSIGLNEKRVTPETRDPL